MATVENKRGVRKQREGIVVSDAANKTIVVKVERKKRHSLYGKVMRIAKRYHAHDEQNQAKLGDYVRITETRPFSKRKRWRLTEIVRTSP